MANLYQCLPQGFSRPLYLCKRLMRHRTSMQSDLHAALMYCHLLPPQAAGLWGMMGLKWRAVYRDRWWGRPIRALAPQTCWRYRDTAGYQSTPQAARSSEQLCCAGLCRVVGGICFTKTHLSSNKPQRWTGDETPHHKHIWLPSSLPALLVQPLPPMLVCFVVAAHTTERKTIRYVWYGPEPTGINTAKIFFSIYTLQFKMLGPI